MLSQNFRVDRKKIFREKAREREREREGEDLAGEKVGPSQCCKMMFWSHTNLRVEY